MGKEPVTIELLGTSFSIQTDEDPVYLSRILQYFKDKTSIVEKSLPIKDPLKVGILTGILVIDELFKERNKFFDKDSVKDAIEAEHIALRLIETIDRNLEPR